MSISPITVAGTVIRTDQEGRFCLNDLHRAAGSEKKHQPGDWMRLQQTQELIAEVGIPGNPGIDSRQRIGTFVCRELVYAYAMWISPTFHIKVIRAYDAIATTGQIQQSTLARAVELLEIAVGGKAPTAVATEKVASRKVHFDFPKELHHSIKRASLDQGISMREFMIEAAESALRHYRVTRGGQQ